MQLLIFRRLFLLALWPGARSDFFDWGSATHDKDASGDFDACKSVCHYQGISATCASRIEYAAQHAFWGHDDRCERAHLLVTNQCNNICGGCSVEASKCHENNYWKPEWGPTTTIPGPTTTESKGCSTMCDIGGDRRTCKDHVQRIANNTYSLAPISCTLAYGWVLERCSQCSVCPTVHTGCTTSPPPPTTTVTSSTSTMTTTTVTATSTSTRTSSTSTVTSSTTSSSTSTVTGTTITQTTTETTTTVTTSTTTTTERQWYKFLVGQAQERENTSLPAPARLPAGHEVWILAAFSMFAGVVVAVRRRISRRDVADGELSIFANVRNIDDPEFAEALAGLE